MSDKRAYIHRMSFFFLLERLSVLQGRIQLSVARTKLHRLGVCGERGLGPVTYRLSAEHDSVALVARHAAGWNKPYLELEGRP